MISITPLQPLGVPPIVLDELPTSKLQDSQSRVSRVATLDGGSVIVDSGMVEADRTLVVEARITEAQSAGLDVLRAQSALVNMSTPTGFYRGAIKGAVQDNGLLKLTFWVSWKA